MKSPQPRYIDAHLHLQDERLRRVADDVIGRARAAHVTRLLCNGTAPADWPLVLDLAARHEGVVPFLGLHPWQVDAAPENWQTELEMLIRTHPAGVGEIGMDFAKSMDRDRQVEAFKQQLSLAARYARPVAVHAVKAWAPLNECLRAAALPAPFMVHAFNGSPEIARELIALGGYVSICALSFSDNRRAKTKTLLQALPCDRILLETESPFGLNPYVGFIDRRDRPNEPANLPAIVTAAAQLIETDMETFAETIYENSMRFIRPLKDVHL